MSASRQDRDETLGQVHADRSRAVQERRYNALTTDLDRAIRLLNSAIQFDSRGLWGQANSCRIEAAFILQSIGPELLCIDPEAIL